MTKKSAYAVSKWLLGGFLLLWTLAQIFFYFRYRAVDLPGLDFAIIAAISLFVFWRANAGRPDRKKGAIQPPVPTSRNGP